MNQIEKTEMLTGATQDSPSAGTLTGRYVDAYRKARFIVKLGVFVKVFGLFAGLVVALGVGAASVILRGPLQGPGDGMGPGLLYALSLGTMMWFICFVLGTLVSASGQFLLASLDSAVNTSPLLNNFQRSTMMGL